MAVEGSSTKGTGQSAGGSNLRRSTMNQSGLQLSEEQQLNEASFGEVDVVMLYLEEARRRAERACAELRRIGAEPHLIEATETVQEQVSELARKYRHGTFFAVPEAQTSL